MRKCELIQQQSYTAFTCQIGIILKALKGIRIRHRKDVDDELAYKITRYVFQNPLHLKVQLFSLSVSQLIKPKVSYLLVFNEQAQLKQQSSWSYHSTLNMSESHPFYSSYPKASAYMTIISTWKSITVNENKLSEVLSKSQRFLLFIKNVELFTLDQQQQQYDFDRFDIDQDFKEYQKKKQQNNKRYHLISQNIQLTYRYFQTIGRYKKDKKVNEQLIKAFLYFLRKNIAIVKIQQNYNTNKLGCEGSYLYIENKNNLPLTIQRNIIPIKQYPTLNFCNGDWILFQKENFHIFKKYESIRYPLNRCIQILLSRKLDAYFRQDVLLIEMSGEEWQQERL